MLRLKLYTPLGRSSFLAFINRLEALLERALLWGGAFWRSFSTWERSLALVLVVIILTSLVWVVKSGGLKQGTQPAFGGTHVEGVVGVPQAPNPLFALNSQVDADLTRLIFSGLVRQGAGREFLPDLASGWQVEEEGKVYTFTLRPDIFWHDGQPFGAQDVIFTIGLIQQEGFKGLGKKEWLNVKVEQLGEQQVRFRLPNANAFFLRQLALGILPQHLWREVALEKLAGSDLNFKPVGTGPYKVSGRISREKAVLLLFDKYYGPKPKLDRVVFRFFPNEKSLTTAFRNRSVTGAGFLQTDLAVSLALPGSLRIQSLLPQYKALFFNQAASPLLAQKAVRQALIYALDRERLIKEVMANQAEVLATPIPPGFPGHKPDVKRYDFDPAAAARLLKGEGWRDSDRDGILEKNQKFVLSLTFRNDERDLKIAEIVRDNWKIVGIETVLKPIESSKFVQEVLRPRDYEILLFGQNLGSDPDPYLYWHSSQTQDPGLNLAVSADKDIDNNLELGRTAYREERIIRFYHNFQDAFVEVLPAVLLYQPTYLYLLDSKIKGVKEDMLISSPTDRLATIADWYIKSERIQNKSAS